MEPYIIKFPIKEEPKQYTSVTRMVIDMSENDYRGNLFKLQFMIGMFLKEIREVLLPIVTADIGRKRRRFGCRYWNVL